MMARVNPTDGSLTNFPAPGSTETPCSFSNYWGDYDQMPVANNGSSLPIMVRYLTDTTASGCVGGNPQHVSTVLGNGTF